jgi:hypothetical protein
MARPSSGERIAKLSESVIRAGFVPDSFRGLSLTKHSVRRTRETLSLLRSDALSRLD